MQIEAYLIGEERGFLDDVFDFIRNIFHSEQNKLFPLYQLIVPGCFILGDFIYEKGVIKLCKERAINFNEDKYQLLKILNCTDNPNNNTNRRFIKIRKYNLDNKEVFCFREIGRNNFNSLTNLGYFTAEILNS